MKEINHLNPLRADKTPLSKAKQNRAHSLQNILYRRSTKPSCYLWLQISPYWDPSIHCIYSAPNGLNRPLSRLSRSCIYQLNAKHRICKVNSFQSIISIQIYHNKFDSSIDIVDDVFHFWNTLMEYVSIIKSRWEFLYASLTARTTLPPGFRCVTS